MAGYQLKAGQKGVGRCINPDGIRLSDITTRNLSKNSKELQTKRSNPWADYRGLRPLSNIGVGWGYHVRAEKRCKRKSGRNRR
ncbi:MAG: hypothetical protein HLUCCA11_20530 [Phormidesmis priestleyi Ana]|uniref:Uncharacterized protein n=1 Tax=Phormidesmis priestleyi Ana TaxID=1666911 RepID=A0A0P8BGH4_9CYAN|nr:MAG: hypothetical protein HLUCCA11_20530 [Phormidesmis priestleyi Ana]